ncbi:hypothetical protein NA57DRAFT_42337 [Rhizodiscina lignyota]|uniref:AB hydrolase-1 domain-containing protein n=1 Tax=Rhizodiscina lignyota TaxID=1504668 RepID=A0A9P4M499_9PEZI|nr:hypothetical protein NA57DRAFT_42337 [Rhizodiscina lignyota]
MSPILYLLLASYSLLAAGKQCANVTVPVNIQARQALFNVPALHGNADATYFAQLFTNIGRNYTDDALAGYQSVTGTYEISAKFCHPDRGTGGNGTVQFLIHGMGFDKSYWDLPFNNYNYSYIDLAVDKYGFCTVSIDRLGIGNSSHADPLNVVQAPAEVSAIYEITKMLRGGTFPGVTAKFHKVAHVGHSFGSVQSYMLSALDPSVSDALVLTGWSNNHTWLPQTLADWNIHLARLNQPLRFGSPALDFVSTLLAKPNVPSNSRPDLVAVLSKAFQDLGVDLDNDDLWEIIATTEIGDIINGANDTVPPVPQDLPSGYVTWSDYTANQFAFLTPPFFDPAIGLFAESTKQPVTLGEIFTLGNGAPETTPFTGPVLVFTGRQDAIYCGGDCLAAGGDSDSIPEQARTAFPNARSFEVYIQPDIGHGISFHYNSTAAYEVIQKWLVQQGLGGSYM